MLDGVTRNRLNKAKDKIMEAHGDDPNVNGAGVAFRRRAGQYTKEPAVVVFVTKKMPEAYISRSRLLPKRVEVNGMPVGVDVVQAGPFFPVPARTRVRAEPPPDDLNPYAPPITEKMRPPRPGCSISVEHQRSAGTLTFFVRDNTDGAVCLLSNNHVLGAWPETRHPRTRSCSPACWTTRNPISAPPRSNG